MKYIDADRLKEIVQVEFDKGDLRKCPNGRLEDFGKGYHFAMGYVLDAIDSLQQEQPEVDLEKELENKRKTLLDAFGPMNGEQSLAIRNFARHFYELGKNARR